MNCQRRFRIGLPRQLHTERFTVSLPSDWAQSAHPRFYFSSIQKWWVTISLTVGGNEAANGCVGDVWNPALRLEE